MKMKAKMEDSGHKSRNANNHQKLEKAGNESPLQPLGGVGVTSSCLDFQL